MNESCPICGSSDLTVQADYRSKHSIFAMLTLTNCRNCGMVFASPMPSEDDLIAYNANYFDNAHGGMLQSKVARAFFSGIARLRSAHIDKYITKNNIEVSNVLEIGPGSGFLARNWLDKNPKTSYMAIETDTSCHASLKKIGVRVIDGKINETGSEIVDLVLMSHVLEHISDPIKFLTDATRNLRKGGGLFIEVPCRDYEHKLNDEPHLLFFDKDPMYYLLYKLGFDKIKVSYHGQEIKHLLTDCKFQGKIMALRSKLINLGLVSPFAQAQNGMESLNDPLERAVIAPYKAHCESSTPAWWLRVVAIKK